MKRWKISSGVIIINFPWTRDFNFNVKWTGKIFDTIYW